MPAIGEKVFYIEPNGYPGFYQEGVIVGETSRSWLVGRENDWWIDNPDKAAMYATKVPKKGTTFADRDKAELQKWAHRNRHRIGAIVQNLTDGQILKHIATLVGFQDEERAKP